MPRSGMTPQRPKKPKQRELAFVAEGSPGFLGNGRCPQDLADLGVGVLPVSARARKWMQVHKISTLGDLLAARKKKVVSRCCLDAQVRGELLNSLKLFCRGEKYVYIFGLNFLGKGLDKILSNRGLRNAPVGTLDLDARILAFLEKKGVATVGELLLQPELPWRNPRILGNISVDEILVALAEFVAGNRK